MIKVRRANGLTPPEWLDEMHWAIPADDKYAPLDEGQGGITTGEVHPEHVRPIGLFGLGDDVFVFSGDVLDDTDDATEHDTGIWWRATVIDYGEPGSEA
jgi:hypothetical protein